MGEQPRVLVVDGMALLFRAFFSTAAKGRYALDQDGVPTNGVQGFAQYVLAAKAWCRPTHLAICWDMGSQSFRNDMLASYKQHRPPPPAELVPQFAKARELADLLGWHSVGVCGMEADDAIASIAARWEGEANFLVLTGDRDLLQLLNPSVRVAFLKKGYSVYEVYDEARFLQEYGIRPDQFADMKALMGDASDGYPGVRGIGPKTALRLMQQYGSIDALLASLEEVAPAVRRKIETDRDMLETSRALARLHTGVDVSFAFDDMAIRPHEPSALEQLASRGYADVLRRLYEQDPFA